MSMKDWSYALGLTIHLPDGGTLDFNRDGIRSESDLIFMAGVVQLRCEGPLSFRCSRVRLCSIEGSEHGRLEFTKGTITNGQVIWEVKS